MSLLLDLIEKYKTIAPYTAEEEDEISFPVSAIVIVVYKSLTGWWMIKCDGNTGLAPATYLKKIEEKEEVCMRGLYEEVCMRGLYEGLYEEVRMRGLYEGLYEGE